MVLSAPVPRDVISYFIQTFWLPNDTLQSCALVSQAFLHPARQLLFTSINLTHGENVPSQCTRLHAIFTANPALALHVKNLTVQEFQPDSLPPHSIHAYWASTSPHLHAILGMLTRLRALSFTFSENGRIAWHKNVSAGLRSALERVFVQPSLEMLRLDGLTGLSPAFFWQIGKGVKTISLDGAATYFNVDLEEGTVDKSWKTVEGDVSGGEPGESEQTHGRGRLEKLEMLQVLHGMRILRALRSGFDISHLREVSVWDTKVDFVLEVLRQSLQSVEVFTWYFYYAYFRLESDSDRNAVDVSAYPNLRIVRLAFDHSCKDVFFPYILQSLAKINAKGVPSKFEELTLHIEAHAGSSVEFGYMLYNHFWRRLDAVLTTETGSFVNLRKVTIYLYFTKDAMWLWRKHGTQSLADYVSKECSVLAKRRLLRVLPTGRTLASILSSEPGEDIDDRPDDSDGDDSNCDCCHSGDDSYDDD